MSVTDANMTAVSAGVSVELCSISSAHNEFVSVRLVSVGTNASVGNFSHFFNCFPAASEAQRGPVTYPWQRWSTCSGSLNKILQLQVLCCQQESGPATEDMTRAEGR
jgi:hypothetical protein